MKSKTRKLYGLGGFYIPLFFILVSCLPAPSPITPTNVNNGNVQAATPVLVSTLESDSSFQPEIKLKAKCVEEVPLESRILDGTLVVAGYSVADDLLLLNLKDVRTIPLGPSGTTFAGFSRALSPGRDKLAYFDEMSRQIVIVDATGRRLETFPDRGNWQGVIQWVDYENLLIEKYIDSPYEWSASVLFNLTNQAQKEYLPDYPDFLFFIVVPNWGNYAFTNAVYDPTFTRVIYPASPADSDDYDVLALWDLEAQREITHFYAYAPDYGGLPLWTKDGMDFIASFYPEVTSRKGNVYKNAYEDLPYHGGYELFRVSRDGSVKRLSYLTTKYAAAEEGLSLSPDDTLVAFWLNIEYQGIRPKNGRMLTILNISTEEITNLCLPSGDYPWPPVWSPDGRYLAVTVSSSGTEYFSHILIVDLEDGTYSKLSEGYSAEGWMSSGQ